MNKLKEINKMINILNDSGYGVEIKYYPEGTVNLTIIATRKDRALIHTEIYDKYMEKEALYENFNDVYNDITHPDRTEKVSLELEDDTIEKIQEIADKKDITFDEALFEIVEDIVYSKNWSECRMRRNMFGNY